MIGILLAMAMFAEDTLKPETISLRCDGNLTTSESDRTGLSTGEASRFRDVNRTATTWIELTGDTGRVRLPYNALLSTKTDRGWRPLIDVQTTADTVTARTQFSVISKPTLRIDRKTGSLVIRGAGGSFSGVCQRQEPNQRLF